MIFLDQKDVKKKEDKAKHMWEETERDDSVTRRVYKPDHSLLWGCPAYCGMFPIMPGLHPLAASSIHLSRDDPKCLQTLLNGLQGAESPTIENHRPRQMSGVK